MTNRAFFIGGYKGAYKAGFFWFVVFFGLIALVGCPPKMNVSAYTNSLMHINLMKPNTWDAAFYERSGRVVLEGKSGFIKKSSARIEIYGGPECHPFGSQDTINYVEMDIERIGTLYSIDPIILIQEPVLIKTANREVIRAVIGLPIADLPQDTEINQFSNSDSETIQTIDLRLILDDTGCFAIAYLYKGGDRILNAQAEAIIDSLNFYP